VVDSTKQTLGSTKRKATSTTQDAQGMAQEKINQASESTKQTTENAKQKLNQAAGDVSNKAGGVRPFFTTSVHHLIYTCVYSGLSRLLVAEENVRSEKRKSITNGHSKITVTTTYILSLHKAFSTKF